jgi:asparagine synthase (glutamine-hydrolysing)
MCGIAGSIGEIDADVRAAVERMTVAQAHRGPDQHGMWASAERGPGAVFGHRRLSILDLSEAGRQPMIDPEHGHVIVFNGEVYNYKEIARDLHITPRSGTDTEIILAAYARLGERAIERLRGMFALAIFDPARGAVLLARDRLGIKPLYLAEQRGRLLFASEVRALLASELVDRRLDEASLASFVWNGFVPGPGTLVSGVRLMEQGTTIWVGLDGRAERQRRYWSVPRSEPDANAERAIERLSAALTDAVRMRLIADVPLGVFASGGIDSSAIAAIAQRASSSPITTVNLRFEEARYDESEHARAVARELGTEHREVTLTEGAFAEHLDDALESLDQPTFDAINTYFVSRSVRESGLTVALAGTGGDELFGGYPSFVELGRARRLAPALALVPNELLSRAARLSAPPGEVPPQARWGKLADLATAGSDMLALYQVRYGLFTGDVARELLHGMPPELEWGLDRRRAAELRAAIDGEPEPSAISRLEVASFLSERLLRDTDAASMAVSLEVRVPLIDHVVIEALARVPIARRFAKKKALLVSTAKLDPRLFDRPKAGFELPLARWCRQRLGPRLSETFHDVAHARRIGVDGDAALRVWRAFEHGRVYWSRVWALFVLSWWCRRHRVYR